MGGRAGARMCWEWASSSHARCAQGLWPHSRLSPTPGWAHGLFSLSRGEQCGLPMGWPCCPASGSHGQPFHGRGKMWAKEVWCPLPPPQLLHFLHPGTFKLLALLIHLSPHVLPPPSPEGEGLDGTLFWQSLRSPWTLLLQPAASSLCTDVHPCLA